MAISANAFEQPNGFAVRLNASNSEVHIYFVDGDNIGLDADSVQLAQDIQDLLDNRSYVTSTVLTQTSVSVQEIT